jgi:hypothetical protein
MQVFSCGIHVRRDGSDGFDAAASMGLGYNVVRVEIMGPRPTAPDTLDRRGRINQNAVHIEEKRFGGEDHLSE